MDKNVYGDVTDFIVVPDNGITDVIGYDSIRSAVAVAMKNDDIQSAAHQMANKLLYKLTDTEKVELIEYWSPFDASDLSSFGADKPVGETLKLITNSLTFEWLADFITSEVKRVGEIVNGYTVILIGNTDFIKVTTVNGKPISLPRASNLKHLIDTGEEVKINGRVTLADDAIIVKNPVVDKTIMGCADSDWEMKHWEAK